VDFLEILTKAERLGGTARKEALTKAIISARDHGCKITPGGGKAGGSRQNKQRESEGENVFHEAPLVKTNLHTGLRLVPFDFLNFF